MTEATIVRTIDPATLKARLEHEKQLEETAKKKSKERAEKKAKEAAEEARLQAMLKANHEGYQAPNNAMAAAFSKLSSTDQKAITTLVKRINEERRAKRLADHNMKIAS